MKKQKQSKKQHENSSTQEEYDKNQLIKNKQVGIIDSRDYNKLIGSKY